MNRALKSMFNNTKKSDLQNKNETVDNLDYEYMTGNMFNMDRNDTSLKPYASHYEEGKEEENPYDIINNMNTKRDDD